MRRASRGLSQLIAEEETPSVVEALLDQIVANQSQPRQTFDEQALSELAASIREHGILQPLTVRPLGAGRYELIAGERRYRAAKLAGLKKAPIVVREANDRVALELAIVENVQREDITPLECARAYQRLVKEFGMTQEQVADKVGKARVSVANTIRLLRLPKRILDGLEIGALSEGHARALLQLETEPRMLAVYDQIVSKGLSVRDVERVAQAIPKAASKKRGASRGSVEDSALEEVLSTHFGSPVKLSRGAEGGKIAIDFFSDEDLQRLLDLIGVSL